MSFKRQTTHKHTGTKQTSDREQNKIPRKPKARFDNILYEKQYNIGDIVLVQKDAPAIGEYRKSSVSYICGQTKITTCWISFEDISNIQRTQKFYAGIAEIYSLKKYCLNVNDEIVESETQDDVTKHIVI